MLSMLKKSLRGAFLRELLRANLHEGEVAGFEVDGDGRPTILLPDSTRLSTFGSRGLPSLEDLGIPPGFQEVAYEYDTRYKYPHFLPTAAIETRAVPRRWMLMAAHRQHRNTVLDLASAQARRLREELPPRRGETALEVGPFIGFGTVRLSRMVGDEGRVVAAEADSAAFEVHSANVAQNGIRNVTAELCAIGDRDAEEAPFWKGGMQANSLVRLEGARPQPVKVRTLSTLLERAGAVPSLMVLTINGFELKVLESSRDFLSQTRPLRIITPGWYSDGEGRYGPRILTLLRSLGFEVFHTRGMHIFAIKK